MKCGHILGIPIFLWHQENHHHVPRSCNLVFHRYSNYIKPKYFNTNNLDKMDRFLERPNDQVLSEEIHHSSRSTFIKNVICSQRLSTKKTPAKDSFTDEFSQILRDKIIPILHKFFPRKWRRKHYNSFFEASITLILTQTRIIQENYRTYVS